MSEIQSCQMVLGYYDFRTKQQIQLEIVVQCAKNSMWQCAEEESIGSEIQRCQMGFIKKIGWYYVISSKFAKKESFICYSVISSDLVKQIGRVILLHYLR